MKQKENHYSRKLSDKLYYQRKKELKMSKLAELHKFVYDTMKVNVDGYLGLGEFREKRLKTTVLVTHLLTDRLEDLNGCS
jgi:hypothetical protein